ncbi:NERD domain-containing protein [Lederbergia lenta]|uniref:Hydrolase n=1 Tax=Lederbergia lenta TaxID=1467 RepID=A0A2X4WAM1_LEDLE|nr:NERD domain-containing protein [Lederbergia lenta]MCM3113388.1 NERD domain-containing protein [Lederbergia lenta]MEC2326467.1 NERD domain-containing protein [Lederbergia lenta]SQI61216.1 hydrolase [Lederbergia lenta]
MAQLIKLQDYISRYENDLTRYPTQFVRLKKQQWEKMRNTWENPAFLAINHVEEENQTKQSFIEKMKGLFQPEAENLSEELAVPIQKVEAGAEEEGQFAFSYTLPLQAKTETELKQAFLDQLLRFQINWASSTIAEKSFVDSTYYNDERLSHFLQRFPDTYFLLYEPIFLLKKAPVEVEVLILTPTEIWCCAFIEMEENAAYTGSPDHFWIKRSGGKEAKILNPGLSASRTEKIIKQIFSLYEVELPIRKAVISRNGYLDYPDAPNDLTMLDKRSYEEWFQKMRTSGSPLKMMQLRAAKALLEYCQTTSFRRPDWNRD